MVKSTGSSRGPRSDSQHPQRGLQPSDSSFVCDDFLYPPLEQAHTIPRNPCRQNTYTHKAFFIIKYNLMEPGLEAPAIIPMQDNLCDIIKEEGSLEY